MGPSSGGGREGAADGPCAGGSWAAMPVEWRFSPLKVAGRCLLPPEGLENRPWTRFLGVSAPLCSRCKWACTSAGRPCSALWGKRIPLYGKGLEAQQVSLAAFLHLGLLSLGGDANLGFEGFDLGNALVCLLFVERAFSLLLSVSFRIYWTAPVDLACSMG